MGVLLSLPWKPIKGHSTAHVIRNIHNYEKEFSARYEAAYTWFFVQSVENIMVEKKCSENKWQLHQRKWDCYNFTLTKGILYVLTKHYGSKWKKRYCVLKSDYSLNMYKSQDDYESGMKPRFIAKFSGFLVTRDVDGHLHQKLTISSRDFGYVNADINAFAKKVTLIGTVGKRPTQHIFLADHPWRGIFYFATETAVEKDHWIKVLQDSIRHLDGCQCDDEIGREAFSFAVEQTVRLQEIYVDRSMLSGTQEEILTDLISAFQSLDCKEHVMPRITGGIVSKYKAWNFVLSAIHDLINGVVTKQYLKWKDVWEENCHAKRQDIINNIPAINQAYQDTSLIIREALAECFDPIVQKDVLPRLIEVVNVMSDSLVSPLRSTRQLFKTLVEKVQKEIESNQEFTKNITQYFEEYLDFQPRDPEFTFPTCEVSGRGSAAVVFLQSVFPQSEFTLDIKTVYTYQQQLLDSAVYTFETLCYESINQNSSEISIEDIEKIEQRVVKKLDYDILLAQKRFFRTVLLSATMERAIGSIEQYCKPKMPEFEATVPENLRCYLPINNVFTDVLTKRFDELINPALKSCIYRMGYETLSKYKKSDSLSSFDTIDSEDNLLHYHNAEGLPVQNSFDEFPLEQSGYSIDVKRNPSVEIPILSDNRPTTSNGENLFPYDDPSSATTGLSGNEEYFAVGEGYGDMDGETGEWYPAGYGSNVIKSNNEASISCFHEDMQDSDNDETNPLENDEYPEHLSKLVVKEMLDSYINEDGVLLEEIAETSHTGNQPNAQISACSLLFDNVAQTQESHGIKTFEPKCNGVRKHNDLSNGSSSLNNCLLTT